MDQEELTTKVIMDLKELTIKVIMDLKELTIKVIMDPTSSQSSRENSVLYTYIQCPDMGHPVHCKLHFL